MAKVLLAKTALDGHWRGLNTVARALRDHGHEVVVLGMARDEEIAAVAIDEDVDLVGLNVGGRIEVVERILDALVAVAPGMPVFAGGTVAPWAARRLAARGVEVFPPGSSLADIADAATRLSSSGRGVQPPEESAAPVADRLTQLLDVAARLFHDEGYPDVGMRAIADAAGTSTGTLYHHFASKNDILYRICLSMTEEFVDSHLPVLEGEGTPAQRLAELVRQHVTFFWEHRHWVSVAFRELRSLEPRQLQTVTAHRRRYQDAIKATVVAGVDAGELDVEDPGLVTLALLDMLNGVNEWFAPGGRLTISELADRYARIVVDRLLGGDRATATT